MDGRTGGSSTSATSSRSDSQSHVARDQHQLPIRANRLDPRFGAGSEANVLPAREPLRPSARLLCPSFIPQCARPRPPRPASPPSPPPPCAHSTPRREQPLRGSAPRADSRVPVAAPAGPRPSRPAAASSPARPPRLAGFQVREPRRGFRFARVHLGFAGAHRLVAPFHLVQQRIERALALGDLFLRAREDSRCSLPTAARSRDRTTVPGSPSGIGTWVRASRRRTPSSRSPRHRARMRGS